MFAGAAQKLQQFKRRGSSVTTVLFNRLQHLGPYLLVELVLPGGTLVALSMYVYQHKRPALKAILARVRMPASSRRG